MSGSDEMASALAGLLIAELPESLKQTTPIEVHAASSCGEHLLTNKVESDHARPISVIEVNGDGVTDHLAQFV